MNLKENPEEKSFCLSEGDVYDLNEGCSVCAPKLALTQEEEVILGQMRAIKRQARPIAERLKALGKATQGVSSAIHAGQGEGELVELDNELNRLRSLWKEWEKRLDKAIETKLILLGHRQPK